jgi:hypothetical protein
MIRTSIVVTSVLSLLLMAGCDQASADQRNAANAQAEANAKIVAANTEANQKANAAQSEADTRIAAAQASFMKLREDYRHNTTTNLVDLDQRVSNLDSRARLAAGTAKVDLDAKLRDIHARRDAFTVDYKALDAAAAATWDAVRTNLDREYTALKKLVDEA